MTATHLMFLAALCLSHLLAGFLTWSWRLRRAGRLTFAGVATGVVAMVAVCLLEVALLRGRGLTRGSIMHLGWLDLVVVTPLAGLGLLLSRRWGWSLTRAARGAAWASFAMVPLAVHAWWIAPRALVLERVDVPLDPARAGSAPITVGVLADLQMARVTDHERRAVDMLMAERPDLVLLPGDLFEGTEGDFEAILPGLRELLGRLSAPAGVWIVTGDVDVHEPFERVTEETAARLLRDEVVELTVRDRAVTLLGLDRRGWSRPALEALEARPGSDDVRLVLVHRPRTLEKLSPDTRVDLVIAGHTHGGQVALPFVGPLYLGSPLPRQVAAGGLHEVDGRRVYISRGVGMERHVSPRIRFGVPPEVSLLSLR